MPHDLVAIARDRSGRELDRAAQWINTGARRSQASLAVRSDAEGQARALRLDWESIGHTQPEGIEVIFDGKPLTVTDPDHIPLPAHDGDEFHYVSASVRFPGHDENRRETDFGSLRTVEISTELTAVVVNLEKRSRLPAARKMRSWFQKNGEALPIHGVEKGAMDLLVVRGPGAQDVLDKLAQAAIQGYYDVNTGIERRLNNWQPKHFFSGKDELVTSRILARGNQLEPLRNHGLIAEKIQLRFISVTPSLVTAGGLEREMFAQSRRYSGSEGGLSWLFQQQPPLAFKPRTSAAVAIAGTIAHSGNHRRAVLLITAGAAEDESPYTSSMTRDFLRALEVPLYVWSFTSENPDREWGEAHQLGDLSQPARTSNRLRQASALLQRDLKNQRVVWLEGRHLPHQITLGPEARGISLAGVETDD